MENSVLALIISVCTIAYTLAMGIFGGAWKLSGKLSQMKEEILYKIESDGNHHNGRIDETSRIVGDSINAVRERMNQQDIHLRDNYIRKDDFNVRMQQHMEVIQLNFNNMNLRFDSVEKKIDNKN